MKKMNNKGFSLIELIIVIAIMAVLVAVIAPNLTGYIGKSKKNTDVSNADTMENLISNALQDFVTDADMKYAAATETDAAASASAADTALVVTAGSSKIHKLNDFMGTCKTAHTNKGTSTDSIFLDNVYTSLEKYVDSSGNINPKVTSNEYFVRFEGSYDKGYTCNIISFDKTKTPADTDFK